MKKSFMAALSFVLCLAIIGSFLSVGFAEETKITTCGEDCEFYPTIIVPGNGQSSVCVTDDEGNFILDDDGNKIQAFPEYFQVGKIIRRVLFPALASLMLQRDIGLSDALADVIDESFGINACDLNGQVVTNVVTEKFPYPYSKCSEYEKTVINNNIPFNKYPTALPDDHIYYFEYNSMGEKILEKRSKADRIDTFIEQIKSMQNMPLVYSDKMFINMVDEVKVTADESLIFKFKNGAEIEELLD